MVQMEFLPWVSFHASGVLLLRLWFCVLWLCVCCHGNSSISVFINSLFAWHLPCVPSVLGSGQVWYGLFSSWVIRTKQLLLQDRVSLWMLEACHMLLRGDRFLLCRGYGCCFVYQLVKASTCLWALWQESNPWPLWCLCSVPTTRLNKKLPGLLAQLAIEHTLFKGMPWGILKEGLEVIPI